MGIFSVFKKKKQESGEKKEKSVTSKHVKESEKHVETDSSTEKSQQKTNIPNTIIRPVITEKAFELQNSGSYTFEVTDRASKQEIQRAVERQFGVKVAHVNVMNTPNKMRRRGQIKGWVSGYRKAVVKLEKDQRIDVTADIK